MKKFTGGCAVYFTNFATEPSKESIDLLYRVQYLTDRGVYSNSSIEEAETYFEKALLNDWKEKYIIRLHNKNTE
ncbi:MULTISPECIES: hypothetical protein [unclassified Lactococcus]|uniref:hypothetical protein n=1 Tax=unclassified Lactococcus TaxID=2643510 RepID=UPI0011C93E4C|nr:MULTISPECIES: hypothetical protein [unclassified Lactococcus]MQW23985.1 hypothetical protein [Lactococcus sp. dk101]TXK36927.1 hypothetical protein FVP42_10415 [Lactococcus sp. dk310]TXK47090.1 hypothetical protein FVP43_10525 [Lactococcus sp. dk322]